MMRRWNLTGTRGTGIGLILNPSHPILLFGALAGVLLAFVVSNGPGHAEDARTVLATPANPVLDVSYHPDGTLLKAETLVKAVLIPTSDGQSTPWRALSDQNVCSLDFDPEGRSVALFDDGKIRIWDRDGPVTVLENPDQDLPIFWRIWSIDTQRLLTRSDSDTLKVRDMEDGELIATISTNRNIQFVVISTPENVIATTGVSDSEIQMWDASTGQPLGSVSSGRRAVTAMTVLSDGRTLASGGSDHAVRLWNLRTRTPRLVVRHHRASVTAMTDLPGDRLIASGDRDGTICLWDADDGVLRRRWDAHQYTITAMTASPDGRSLISASNDGTVVAWNLDVLGVPSGSAPSR